MTCVCDPAHVSGAPCVLRGGCGGGCTVGVLPGRGVRRGDPGVSPVPPPGRDSARPDTLITQVAAWCPPAVTGLVALSPDRGHRDLMTCSLTGEMSFGEAQPALSLPPFPGCSGGIDTHGCPRGGWDRSPVASLASAGSVTRATVPLCLSFPWQSWEGTGHVPTR